MWEKFKFFISGAAIVTFLFVAYFAGKDSGPELTYDAAFEIVKEKKAAIVDKKAAKMNSGKRYNYIPAYSHVYISNGQAIEMAITLSLRNVDKEYSVKINKIFYYNTKGELIRHYLKDGYELQPLESKEIFIERKDTVGGSGANFLVEYTLEGKLIPLFETIMATNDENGKSYIFASRGRDLPQ